MYQKGLPRPSRASRLDKSAGLASSCAFFTWLLCILSILVIARSEVAGQSDNPQAPTPLESPVVEGQIDALDPGDPRMTRHYYVFNGSQGDLTFEVESTNLNGDVDFFTSAGLRPLSKVTVFARSSPFSASKTFFL